jgi:phosphoribosylpyrophosphate synthetase
MASSSVQMQEVRRGRDFRVRVDQAHSHAASRVITIADKLGIEFALVWHKHNGKSEMTPAQMEIIVGDVRDKAHAPGTNAMISVNLVSPDRNSRG